MKNEIVRLGLILGIVSMVASASLSFVNAATEPIITARIAAEADQARKDLLPEAEEFKLVEADLPEGVTEVYSATKGSETIGYIVSTQSKGYGGTFDVTVGINEENAVTGVKLSNMNETPGLGAKATEPAFIDQFEEIKSETKPFVSKNATGAESEIVAISGATITSDAVVVGVNIALDYYNSNLK